jgi:hypothetical protein
MRRNAAKSRHASAPPLLPDTAGEVRALPDTNVQQGSGAMSWRCHTQCRLAGCCMTDQATRLCSNRLAHAFTVSRQASSGSHSPRSHYRAPQLMNSVPQRITVMTNELHLAANADVKHTRT